MTQFLVRESSRITTLSKVSTHLEHTIHHDFLPTALGQGLDGTFTILNT